MLEHLFGSKTRLKLLQIFFQAPGRSFFMRELARMAETQLNAIRRELSNLEQCGVIIQVDAKESAVEDLGTERSKYYKLNPNFFLLDELKALLTKAQILAEQDFIETIKKRAGDVKLFLLSGAFVGQPEAGTDMLIVGKIKPLALARIIKDFEKFLNHSLRYTLMEEKEYKDRREIGDKFLYGIFESKHIVVVDSYSLV